MGVLNFDVWCICFWFYVWWCGDVSVHFLKHCGRIIAFEVDMFLVACFVVWRWECSILIFGAFVFGFIFVVWRWECSLLK